jgi:hypothetical protein
VEEQKFVTPLSHLKALGLEVSLLIGLGKNVSLDEARGLIESGHVLDYLQRDQGVDLSIWKKPQIDEINLEFQSLKAAIEANPNFGLDAENGMAFLMAHILEGIANRCGKTEPAPLNSSGRSLHLIEAK